MSAGLPTLDLPGMSNGNGHASIHKMPSSSTMSGGSDEDLTFDSPEEEIAHYREKYRQALDMLTETRAELEEFQQSSKELEDEMEQELASNDKQQAELREKIKRLEVEKDDWKSKQIALQKMHSSTTANMQREMDNLRSERDKTLVALRDLEMGNDELERNERVAVSSLLDLESKYNRAIEEKTLLEQEIIQKQELEEECQRLKDDMRDANNEIAILKDQLARATLLPPQLSAPMSPVQEASREISFTEEPISRLEQSVQSPQPPPVPSKNDEPPRSPYSRLPRSASVSSIPVASPSAKRFATHIPNSPSGLSSLSRSTTSRNLASVAAGMPSSPALSRSRSGIPQASPARVAVLASHQQTKSRGFKLLHDLQARLKATDDKLGAKVPRRNVSNPMPLTSGRRVPFTPSAAATIGPSKATHARVTALANHHSTPGPAGGKSMMSPNGWVLVGDGEGDETPTGPASMTLPDEPPSPLVEQNFRAVSSASTSSNRSLPSRPGIPSPLASVGGGLNRSTSIKFPRPASRMGAGASTTTTTKREQAAASNSNNPNGGPLSPTSRKATNSRPMSPSMIPTPSSRPMSPSMLPQLSRSVRGPSPAFGSFSASIPSSTAGSATSSRPSSRTERPVRAPIGRGPPPVTSSTRQGGHKVSSSLNTSEHLRSSSNGGGLRRSTRRSSFGAHEANLPPTGIPAPRTSIGGGGGGGGTSTPGKRPNSVHVFGSTPPPVPRIPSALLKDKDGKRRVLRNGGE
ncbi:hypothetical protein CI109_104138 [Kwoniella shandongensis]|uniref:NUDE domain-containing protein n=1 Tax=Kwoniella shandongensis TaxID=1734106 RepID=A0A5M6C6I8_9TREE|nr:uncharacterized protein CI109_002949 [Kwoniella shandongensis]KAA5528789.1 hypothetical protein CI109_002949 [Kwoniella shandongensis]